MKMTPCMSVSELTRSPSKALEGIEQSHKILMRNNQPIGYVIGVDNPLSRHLGLDPLKDDLDRLESYFEKGLRQHYRLHFTRMHGVELAKGAHSIDRLIGVDDPELMRQLPGRDHCELWERDGEPALFTMQVYGMRMDTHNALRDFCIKHGLVYRTERRSWYYPGVSTLIVIEKAKEGT